MTDKQYKDLQKSITLIQKQISELTDLVKKKLVKPGKLTDEEKLSEWKKTKIYFVDPSTGKKTLVKGMEK